MISIQICEHCGAVKDAETPSEIVQTLKKIGWELKRAEGKVRPAANMDSKPAKKKETREDSREDSREENGNGNHSEVEEPVAV